MLIFIVLLMAVLVVFI